MYLKVLSIIAVLVNSVTVIVLALMLLWLYSEIWITKDSKNRKEINTTAWLIINFLLPFLGFLLYKISCKTIDDNK